MAELEAKAARAAQFLTTIHEQLQQLESPEAVRWLAETSKLRSHSSKTSAVIGVIGATGAGKSALVNALLDEERILPTNCMRACTAVITEISYNNTDIPYRAEVEFINEDDWRHELKIMYGDLLDAQGNISANSRSEDNEVGVAYSKLKAVYPGISKERFSQVSIDELMAHESMSHLGTTKIIEEQQADTFYAKLQIYVDSKEKVDLRLKSAKSSSRALEFWPLIKVVRLFVKSRALKSGAVLVDLPGVHDSNAARAAIAQSYLKECSGLFIVAPITRAVDDKSAKTLLGQSFKQQLKLDGSFGNVTFICSKTDEIAVFEAQESLGLGEQLAPLHQEINAIEMSMKNFDIVVAELKKNSDAAEKTIELLDLELESYLRLRYANEGSDPSKVPSSTASGKRKRTSLSTSSRKRTTIQSFFDIDSEDDQHNDEEDDEIEEVKDLSNPSKQPLDKANIEQKISELRERREAARSELHKLVQSMKEKEQEPRTSKKRHTRLRTEIAKLCISSRNDYSRTAIKQDFADGIQEIDQELAAEEDPENFDPSEVLRDYDEVAQSLSVFCVSSRGYQKLIGNLKTEKKALGLETTMETEIPQLQDHCLQVAETLQTVAFEAFLGKVAVLCNSLKIWTLGQEENNLTEDEWSRRDTALKTELQDFTKDLLEFTKSIVDAVRDNIHAHIISKFDRAVEKATQQASETVERWGQPVNRDDPEASGLHFSTYKATTRRKGYFPKKTVTIDFNEELTSPLVNRISHGWEKVFNRLAPSTFKDACQNSEAMFVAFRSKINATATQHGISATSLQLLEKQLDAHASTFKNALNAAMLVLRDQQKEINRQFIPAIADSMAQIYDDCAMEHGRGMFVRVKRTMSRGVQEEGESMFRACAETIEDSLEQMVKTIQQDLTTKTRDVTSWIKADYLTSSNKQNQEILLEEKVLKNAILKHINEYESGHSQVVSEVIKTEHHAEQMNPFSLPVHPSPSYRNSAQPNSPQNHGPSVSQEQLPNTIKCEEE